ncbi:hypothetical protein NQ315_003944 [Exocentrus adspersus]|uniref:Uncharacterized protein n=1 Tax=Exocentrus adspersus TaxID=1586481 RepID=A0AAV8VYI5_9CUCU|nr:hypothetical protein NQ315_003944 [Exocentrus adspersus]
MVDSAEPINQIMQYVRNLEQRVKQLEEDKRSLIHKINQIATNTGDPTIAIPQDTAVGGLTGRPEAVVRALQVLEVREQLEREGRAPERSENMSDTTSQDMDDGEKALVREMCNANAVPANVKFPVASKNRFLVRFLGGVDFSKTVEF